jgi:hypothetical protein
MQVTITFEELKLFTPLQVTKVQESQPKMLHFKVCKHHQLYALALFAGAMLLLFKLWTLGIGVLVLSSVVFAICTYFKQAFALDIRFTEKDGLQDAVNQDLFD